MPSLTSALALAALALTVSAQTAGQWGQCGGLNWTGATICPSGWVCTYSNDFYWQCLQGTAATLSTTTTKASSTTTTTKASSSSSTKPTTSTTTTTKASSTTTTPPTTVAAGTPTGLTTVFPTPVGSTSRSSPITVTAGGSFNGNMWRYDRNPKVCAEQEETGEADTIFILENGATLSNVFIGPAQAEGVHCKGTCTLNNVWWEDVCEDGATFKQTSGTSYVNGGGAKGASDKVFQHNGAGTLQIKNFFVNNFGKLYRSCGNCSGNGASRHVVIDNIVAKDGDVIAGINTNYGDTAKISNSCINGPDICDRFKGTTSGEPTKIGSGPDGVYCIATNIVTNC